MPALYLVLTNPYAYDRALKFAVKQAQQADATLNVVFLIDPDAIDSMVRDLGEHGWLGSSSRQALYESMLEGYGALATDTIETIHRRIEDQTLSLKTSIREASLDRVLQELSKDPPRRAIVSASRDLRPPSSSRPDWVKWMVED